ncbi:O-antigen/teichoic acid export membrane protein [Kribbella pratensis]|uniref:O-antigen/teichoic acid export membrane protein n=1 Tax=Kribbella pratensis TaxID=2512112 RepID=A0ABY2FN88_9ACTN|nr:hypothetical protein [Kribbella pratensis]TDW94239.1 O-antigen/teichoic acid export membrane protein [Kribbella pratensis]
MSRIALWRQQIAGRLGWAVADQAVSSLENFLLGVFVANVLGAEGLGALGLAFVAYSIALSCSRALATDALMIRFSGTAGDVWRTAASAATGVALLTGTAIGVICVGLGLILKAAEPGSEAGIAFLAIGIAMPALTLQDSWRCAFFAAERGARAFLVDVVWTVLFLSLLMVVHLTGNTSLMLVLIGFGATALVAAVAGMIYARTVPRVHAARSWLRAHRDLGTRFLVENVVMGAGGQIRAPVVAAAVGLAAVGAIRAAEMLIGPVAALLMGISQVSVPEAARALRKGSGPLLRLCLGISAGLASVAFAWGLVVIVIFPFGIGSMLLDGVWPDAHRLVLGVMVSSAFGCLQIGPSAGLRALGRADRTMRCQLVVSALFILLGTVGAVTGGALGAVWGTAIASAVGSAIWWWQFLRARREYFEAAGELIRPGKHFKTTGAAA